jgi:hypothetical protein
MDETKKAAISHMVDLIISQANILNGFLKFKQIGETQGAQAMKDTFLKNSALVVFMSTVFKFEEAEVEAVIGEFLEDKDEKFKEIFIYQYGIVANQMMPPDMRNPKIPVVDLCL